VQQEYGGQKKRNIIRHLSKFAGKKLASLYFEAVSLMIKRFQYIFGALKKHKNTIQQSWS
jgi:hypothetical protein